MTASASARLSALFRKRLLGVAVLLNVLVVAFAGAALYRGYQGAEDDAVVATQNLSNLLAHDIAASLDKIDMAVVAVADEAERQLAAGGVDRAVLEAFMAKHSARLPGLDSLRVLDREGRIAFGSGVGDMPHLSAAHRAFFVELRDHRTAGPLISEPLLGQISGKWSIALARRVEDANGRFAGVAFAVILLETFKAQFSQLDIGPHGVVSLRDLQLGTVVRHPEPGAMETAIGNRTHSKEWPEKLKENPVAGTYFAVGLDGLNRALSYARVDKYPFYVIVGMLPADYLATWKRDAVASLFLLIAFGLVTAASCRFITRAWVGLAERERALQFLQKVYEVERSARAEQERIGHLKDDLMANVGHELRGPVSAIIGWSTVLMRRHSNEDQWGHALRVIERNALAQAAIIDDLLDMQRIATGLAHLASEPVEMLPLLRDVVDTLAPVAATKSVAFHFPLEAADTCACGDAPRIRQSLLNVLGNAIKFSLPGGNITLGVEPRAPHVVVTVRDEGVGIDPVALPYVFDRLRPADANHSERQSGLGLGLAIAKQLIELQGGFITAESAGRGCGTTICLGLPSYTATDYPGGPDRAGAHGSMLQDEQA